MIFKFAKRRRADSESSISESIEDAILLGHVDELDDALAQIDSSGVISNNLRYGIEALRYFRAYYGKDGELEPKEPLQKRKAVMLESAWGSELLDMLKTTEAAAVKEG